jgi:hypothetical protein
VSRMKATLFAIPSGDLSGEVTIPIIASAEREGKSLRARIEKLDLELPISDGLRLPDQLTGRAARPLKGRGVVPHQPSRRDLLKEREGRDYY